MRWLIWYSSFVVVTCFATGCEKASKDDAPPRVLAEQSTPHSNNLLRNPSFEEGRDGWTWKEQSLFWRNFDISDTPTHSGKHSVKLTLASNDSATQTTKVVGVVQELNASELPARVGGYYYVKDLTKSDPAVNLYLQVAVIVWGNAPSGFPNHQLRYYLAGESKPALNIGNAKVEIVDPSQPKTGVWVEFDLPLRADFERLWGAVPEGYDRIEVFFEVRWDNMTPEGAVAAEVYFDDLFVDPYAPAVK